MVADPVDPAGRARESGDDANGVDNDDYEATVGGGEDGLKEPLLRQQEGRVSDPARASVLGLILFQWVRLASRRPAVLFASMLTSAL